MYPILITLLALLAACTAAPGVPLVTPPAASIQNKSVPGTPPAPKASATIVPLPEPTTTIAATATPLVITTPTASTRLASETATPITATATQAPALTSATVTATFASARAYPFERIFIIVFENHGADTALINPYFKSLTARGAYLSNYHGVGHPSQPNYLALLSGATFVSDDGDYNLPQSNLVDLLEGAGISWKAYQENYPGSCFTGAWAGDAVGGFYARKHNPFISFDSVRKDPARCAKIVKADQLAADISADQLPAFSFYTPNQNNDGHDRPLSFAAQWFQSFIEPKLSDPHFMRGTLVVVTFDETDSDPGGANGNHIYTLLLGAGVKAGSVDTSRYDHYSLLRTVEDNFALGTLKRADASAKPFSACNFGAEC
jgi:phosphoesterase family protein